jgi:hypothetical protein
MNGTHDCLLPALIKWRYVGGELHFENVEYDIPQGIADEILNGIKEQANHERYERMCG